ncbi:MAG: glycosyltransferase family 2 protein, partial [Chloroflexota bacterium]
MTASVESVRRQTLPPAEIIVVVDHNPALLERVHSCMPAATGLANERHAGASGSRNTGVAASRGAIVAFLDDDAEAAPDWLERLCSCYGDPRILGVGGAIQPTWMGKQPAWLPGEFMWVVGCTYIGMSAKRAPIRNLISANMSVRREIFEALGGFRSGFGDLEVKGNRRLLRAQPPTDEEAEFCIRGLQKWPDCYWVQEPRAKVRHRVSEQRARFK